MKLKSVSKKFIHRTFIIHWVTIVFLSAHVFSAHAQRETRLDGEQGIFPDTKTWVFGSSVAAGDLNADGYADLVVGQSAFSLSPGSNEGKVHVYYGAPAGYQDNADAVLMGDTKPQSRFGSSVAVDDINNDGYADVLAGAENYSNGENSEGKIYLYLGSSAGISGTAVWSTEINQASAKFGSAIAKGGDVNLDGFNDVIVSASGYSNGESGEGVVLIYYGNSGGLQSQPQWLFEFNQANAQFGKSISSAGDVNNDGFTDIFIGANQYANGEADEGGAFLYYGSASGFSPNNIMFNGQQIGLVGPADIDWSTESNQANAKLGESVFRAGDVNGDGYDDIIVGAWGFNNGLVAQGRSYLFHGAPDSGGVSGMSSTPDWIGTGLAQSTSFGNLVSTAGDVNSDGYSDVLIGGPFYTNSPPFPAQENSEGSAWIYFGSSAGLSLGASSVTTAEADWQSESNNENALFGTWGGPAFDVDGDGIDDYFISAPGYDADNQSASFDGEGSVFVYLSGPAPEVVVTPTSGLNTSEGGGTATFSINLNVQPIADVSVNLSCPNPCEGSLSSTTLMFTGGVAGNWSTPQMVTVTGVDDFIHDGDQAYTIAVEPAVSSDSNFNGLDGTDVSLVNIDDDVPGITVLPSAGLYTTEGESTTFAIVLDTKPTSNVSLSLSSDSPSVADITSPQPAQIIFSPLNWSAAQNVTVTAQMDSSPDIGVVYHIVTDPAVSADADYNGLDPVDVAITNTIPSVSIAATDSLATEPGVDAGQFEITRVGNTNQPLTVSYMINSASTATAGVDYSALTGTVTIPIGQTSVQITVSPLNDSITEVDESVIVNLTGQANIYILGTQTSATVTIRDDDIPPTASFALDQQVAEGSTVTVNVRLAYNALVYPVSVPFTVSGSASYPADHNAQTGVITISSGTIGSYSFNTVKDSQSDDGEQVILTMGTPVNALPGAKTTHIVEIKDAGSNSSSSGGGAIDMILLLAALSGVFLTRVRSKSF